ncbi:Verru_Chthon cassette protein B [Verrucomicrobiales bacterium BCK34]|nr:Verru_Chthon cassette protein B [Verrucomicrobiales bacterium BCK34]
MKYVKSTSRACIRGFSLVEVTIAMAIASVALVTLMGLIPQGMDTMREAGDTAIEARIHQQVLNELQLTPFDDDSGNSLLDTYYNGLEIYYDSQGEEMSHSKNQGSVDDDKKKGSFSHIYSARVSVPSESGGKMPESVGGGNFSGFSFGGTDTNTNIRPVIVEITSAAGGDSNFDWDSDDNARLISSYQSVVVKMGRDLNAN